MVVKRRGLNRQRTLIVLAVFIALVLGGFIGRALTDQTDRTEPVPDGPVPDGSTAGAGDACPSSTDDPRYVEKSDEGRIDVELNVSVLPGTGDEQPRQVWLVNHGDIPIGYGLSFALERHEGDGWTQLPTYPTDNIALTLTPGESSRLQDVTTGEAQLEPGCYRVSKSIDVLTAEEAEVVLTRDFEVE